VNCLFEIGRGEIMMNNINQGDSGLRGAYSERSFLLVIMLTVAAEISSLIWWLL
jgi:hypothetical protein